MSGIVSLSVRMLVVPRGETVAEAFGHFFTDNWSTEQRPWPTALIYNLLSSTRSVHVQMRSLRWSWLETSRTRSPSSLMTWLTHVALSLWQLIQSCNTEHNRSLQ